MHPTNKEQAAALKAIAKALKVAFESDKGSAYNPAFVAKILAGEKAKNDGEKGLKVDVENLWK